MPGIEIARCSFCREQPRDIRHLVRAAGVSICADCIRVCSEVLRERGQSLELDAPRPAPRPREASPRPAMIEELPTQPRAARLLDRIAEAVSHRSGEAPGSVLLLGPSGTGKSRALRALADLLPDSPRLVLDLAEVDAEGGLATRLAAVAPGTVVLLDSLERVAARADFVPEIERLLGGPGQRSSPATVFAALSVTGDPGQPGPTIEAQLSGRALERPADPVPLLALAASRGVSPSLLARFCSFVPFAPLGPAELKLLLAARAESLVNQSSAHGCRLRISEEAAELIVERALRLGGGAWGLKAVLAATLSGLEPQAGDGDVAPPASPRRARRSRSEMDTFAPHDTPEGAGPEPPHASPPAE